MRRIALVAAVALLAVPAAGRAACTPDLTLRWGDAASRPAPGPLRADSPVLLVPPFLTNPAMAAVGRANHIGGIPVVRLHFAPEAAEVLAREAAAQPDGALVIMLGATVLLAVVVHGPLGDTVDIDSGTDAAAADRLAIELQRWLESCRRKPGPAP